MNDYGDILNIIEKYKENVLDKKEVWIFIENLRNELEACRKQNICLESQIENLTIKVESSNSTLCIEQEEQIIELIEQNNALKMKMQLEREESEKKKLEIENSFETKLMNLESQITQMKHSLASKEMEFYEELQMAQVTSAREFGKIEQELKCQLTDANIKLNEVNEINLKLRNQLKEMENQREPHHADGSLQSKISDSLNRFNYGSSSTAYEPFQSGYVNRYEEVLPQPNRVLQQQTDSVHSKHLPPLFKGQNPPERGFKNKPTRNHPSSRVKVSTLKNEKKVPPLIPCTTAMPLNRKRRLYDPDDAM